MLPELVVVLVVGDPAGRAQRLLVATIVQRFSDEPGQRVVPAPGLGTFDELGEALDLALPIGERLELLGLLLEPGEMSRTAGVGRLGSAVGAVRREIVFGLDRLSSKRV